MINSYMYMSVYSFPKTCQYKTHPCSIFSNVSLCSEKTCPHDRRHVPCAVICIAQAEIMISKRLINIHLHVLQNSHFKMM